MIIEGVVLAVFTLAILLQFVLPPIFWCFALCKKTCKKANEERKEERRRQEFTGDLERRLESVARAQNQEYLDQSVQEYQQTVQEYQKETEEQEKKRRRGLCRLYSMVMYFSFFLWGFFLIGCHASQCFIQYGAIFLHFLWTTAIVMCIVSLLFVLKESFGSHERDYLKNIMKDETAWDYIRRIHAVAPVINMQVECYHLETRTRTVYYTDANGNQQSSIEAYQEKVVTFVDVDTFEFGSWVDVSKREMPELSTVTLTRLKIDGSVLFGDQETADDFDRQRQEMLARNVYRDVYADFSSNKKIPGLKKSISAYVDLREKSFWIRERYYWLATLLCMTWPYRWVFKAKTAKNYYAIKKKLYKSNTPPVEVDLMNPIAMLHANGEAPYPVVPPLQGPNAIPMVNVQGARPYPSTTPYPPQVCVPLYPTSFPEGVNAPYPVLNEGAGPAYPPNQGAFQPSAPPPMYDTVVAQGVVGYGDYYQAEADPLVKLRTIPNE